MLAWNNVYIFPKGKKSLLFANSERFVTFVANAQTAAHTVFDASEQCILYDSANTWHYFCGSQFVVATEIEHNKDFAATMYVIIKLTTKGLWMEISNFVSHVRAKF